MAMIEEYVGDIFAIKTDVKVNPVNIVGVMGKGLARQFKNRYPEMYDDYVAVCNRGFDIGQLHIYRVSESEIVVNFPTKRHWKYASEYEYIDKGLKQLGKYLNKSGADSVAIPMLGCGCGGLDRTTVKRMIRNILLPILASHVTVYFVVPTPSEE